MNNPYSILGIPESATDEEIKKAYRTLSRKYHPDANINNPNKDQAEAKFKEVQQAYQKIMHDREYGTSSSSGSSSSQNGGYSQGWGYGPFGGFEGQYRQADSSGPETEEDLHLKAAANYINSGYYQEALNLLNNISNRNARWYYYSAMANSGLGNNVMALEHAKEALKREPNNYQYQMLVSRLEHGGSWYQQRQSPYSTVFTGGNDLCLKLCLLNMFCNCCCNGSMCCGGPGYGGYTGGGGFI